MRGSRYLRRAILVMLALFWKVIIFGWVIIQVTSRYRFPIIFKSKVITCKRSLKQWFTLLKLDSAT